LRRKQSKQTFFESSLEVAQSIREDTPERVTTVEGTNRQMRSIMTRAPIRLLGQLITWVFIPLFGISALFASERQQGTLRRLLPRLSQSHIFAWHDLRSGCVGTCTNVSIGRVRNLVMKLGWGREPLALFVILLASALAAAAFGTTWARSSRPKGRQAD
jgi:ABC-2 type transport system permease protein